MAEASVRDQISSDKCSSLLLFWLSYFCLRLNIVTPRGMCEDSVWPWLLSDIDTLTTRGPGYRALPHPGGRLEGRPPGPGGHPGKHHGGGQWDHLGGHHLVPAGGETKVCGPADRHQSPCRWSWQSTVNKSRTRFSEWWMIEYETHITGSHRITYVFPERKKNLSSSVNGKGSSF